MSGDKSPALFVFGGLALGAAAGIVVGYHYGYVGGWNHAVDCFRYLGLGRLFGC